MTVFTSHLPGPPADTWLERAGLACVLALPVMLLHGRGIADILIVAIDMLFLLRSARRRDWGWLRQTWVAVAASWFVWLVLCSVLAGPWRPILQALVVVRLLLLVAACQSWVLAPPRAQRWLHYVFAACAVWIAVESWQQLLLGTNLFGFARAQDGVITGPFGKERAGQIFLDVIFPGVLPFVLRSLDRAGTGARLGGLAALAAMAATVVLIGQRMPLLLLLLGLAAAGLLVRRLRWVVVAAGVAAAIMGALLPLVSPLAFDRLVLQFLGQMRHFWVSDYGQIYVRALNMIGAHPWFGLGYDGFRNHCLEAAYVTGNALVGVADGQVVSDLGCNIHPHNHWLEVATSTGLPGLALFALLAALWLRGLWRAAADSDGPLHTALVVTFIVLFWPLSARSSLFVVDAGGWAFFIAGWALATARRA